MTYRRITESPDQAVVRSSRAEQAVPRIPGDFTGDAAASCGINRDDSVDEEIHHYARVHLLSQDLPLSDREWNRPISNKEWNLPLSRKEWDDLTEASATLKAELASLDDSDESKRERIELELQYSGDMQRRDARVRLSYNRKMVGIAAAVLCGYSAGWQIRWQTAVYHHASFP